jgi:hypothetical protein
VDAVQYPDTFWWSSLERFALVIPGSEVYGTLDEGGVPTEEVLEIDLGRIREVNYITMDVLKAPLDIRIEYDAISAPDRTAQWTEARPIDGMPFDDQLFFDAGNRTAWANSDFFFTSQHGNVAHTRYLRITFTRRDDRWPTATSQPFKWPVMVKHLRMGRYISEYPDTASPLLTQDTPAAPDLTLSPLAADTEGGTVQVRQRFRVPRTANRGGDVWPTILGFGVLVEVNPFFPEGDAALPVVDLSWSLWDVSLPTPAQLASGAVGDAYLVGTNWVDWYLSGDDPVLTNPETVYEFRVESGDAATVGNVFLSEQSLSSTPLPGTFAFVAGSATVTATNDISRLVAAGNWVKTAASDTVLRVLSLTDSTHFQLTAPFPSASAPAATASRVYPLLALQLPSGSLFRGEVLTSGPSHYWRLGEPSGSALDEVLGTLNGAIVGGVTQGTAGLLTGDANTAYTFNGSTGKVSLGQLGATPRHYMAIIKTASADERDVYSNREDSAHNASPATVFGISGTHAFAYNQESTVPTCTGSRVINDNLPHIIEYSWDPAVGVGTLYVDGQIDVMVNQPVGTLAATTNYHSIGWDKSNPQFFNGVIDEVATWSTVQSADTVSRRAARFRGQAFTDEGTFVEQGQNNLVMRVWADLGDEGRDVLGNAYRYGVRREKAAYVVDGGRAGWMSDPAPSKDAVEALYFDLREFDADAGENVLRLVDGLRIAPRTPGVRMNVYYSKENLQGDRPASVNGWDYLLWQPLSQNSFVLRPNQVIEFPQPIRAAYVKLEFTDLNPIPWKVPAYPPLPPKPFRRFPTWVEDQFTNSQLRNVVEDWWLRQATPVQSQVLSGLTDPVREFEYKEREFFAKLALGEVDQSKLINQTLVSAEDRSVFDPVTASRIWLAPADTFGDSLLVSVDQDSILGRMVVSRFDPFSPGGTTERAGPRPVLDTIPTVSSINNRISDSYSHIAQVPMRFNTTCRHAYREDVAEFNKKGFFVGIDEVQFLRNDYSVMHDDPLIQDILHDDFLLEVNTWEPEDTTQIGDGDTVYVSYQIGLGTDYYVDEAVTLDGNLPVQLAGKGDPILNVRVFASPAKLGLTYWQGDDWILDHGRDANGVATHSITRSVYTERLGVSEQPIVYADGGIVVGRGVIPAPPITYTDAGTVVGVAGLALIALSPEGKNPGEYGMGTYGDAAGTYDDLRAH